MGALVSYVMARVEERRVDLALADALIEAVGNSVEGKRLTKRALDILYPEMEVAEETDPREIVKDITERAGLIKT